MFRLITRLSLLVSLAHLPLRSNAFRTPSYSTCTGVVNSVRKSNLESTTLNMAGKSGDELPKTEEGWRTVLNPEQFRVLRMKSTEPSGFSERTPGQLEFELKKTAGTKYPKEGTYDCVACGSPLYTAQSKFDSGCGWPAFYEGVPGAIKEIKDADGRRVEILCNNCGSHLGHVFKNEGFSNPTNERHCVNGICLKYEPKA